MAAPDDDDLAVGEALIRELSGAVDPVAQGDALDGVWDCHDRLIERDRHDDALRFLDSLLAWQLSPEAEEVSDELAEEEIAHTMLGRAAALRNLDRQLEVVAQCDDLINRSERANNPSDELQLSVANARSFKGSGLLSLGRWLEALVVFDDLIARESAVSRDERRWVAYAREERGQALKGLGDDAGAVEAYADAIAALADDDDPQMIRVVEKMMFDQARLLAGLGRTDEAFAIFDQLIALPEPHASLAVVGAYMSKSYRLAERGDFEATIATADAAVQRFSSSEDATIRRCVALCLESKILALKALGRKDAAAHAAEQLVERFGADLDPNIERIVAPHAHRLGRGRSRLRFLGLG
jgi:tetratricopeptide (TPR) repeat protein